MTHRFFTQDSLSFEKSVVIDTQEFHHLHHVMRVKEKDEVELVNGRGELGIGRVVLLGKKEAKVELTKVEREPPPLFRIELLVASLRGNRLDLIIEKGTELRATAFF